MNSNIVNKDSIVAHRESRKSKNDSCAKYNLRTKSIQNRIEVERRKSEPRHPKPKQRPAPLSKYRRKTANLRERCRMQEMNDAFKRLQSVVPDIVAVEENCEQSNKLTKINTLKLAVNYISALTQMLKQTDCPNSAISENTKSPSCHRLVKEPRSQPVHGTLTVESVHKSNCRPSRVSSIDSSDCSYDKPSSVRCNNNWCDSNATFSVNDTDVQCNRISLPVGLSSSNACSVTPNYSYFDFMNDGSTCANNDSNISNNHLNGASNNPCVFLNSNFLVSSSLESNNVHSCTRANVDSLSTNNIDNILDDFDTFLKDFEDESFAIVDELID